MIISKKRFQEEIAKAIQEADEKRWQYERVSQIENDVHRRIDLICERLNNVEKILNQPIHINDAVTANPLHFLCDGIKVAIPKDSLKNP